jgi:ferredoxin/flavodoxin---NADP+ reductase
MSIGTDGTPLRVAIIGSGPAGFYTAEHLQRHAELAVEVDMFDRLPTPYGLVRGGVAPDHQKIKSVTKAYERIATRPGFRFYGCVELGRDIHAADLARHYHAVVIAVGAPIDRRMGIPGEDLPGSLSATDFVAWYNAHPDYTDLDVRLDTTDAVVVGNGNVAIDVARILATPVEILAGTDIADHALERLRSSQIRSVTMIGRRGPAQAAFTPKEIRELGDIPGVTLRVDPADLALDTEVHSRLDEDGHRVLGALREVAGREPGVDDRVIRLRFLTSPTDLRGRGRVEEVATVRNVLVEEGGALRAKATGETGTLPAGLVLRAVGYRGEPVPGYPFDERAGVIPNDRGRVVEPDGITGGYVAGWIKRGPQGVIGTNKADAGETVAILLEDLDAGRLASPADPSPQSIDRLVRERVPHAVSWDDWRVIDEAECAAGAAAGRPRRKFAAVEDMLRLLRR